MLLTSSLPETPYYKYFPGDPADTAAYKYQDRPVICYKCYKYGHTIKQCRQKQTRRKCGGEDHEAGDWINELKCPNCGKGHMARIGDCETEKREKSFKKYKLTAK